MLYMTQLVGFEETTWATPARPDTYIKDTSHYSWQFHSHAFMLICDVLRQRCSRAAHRRHKMRNVTGSRACAHTQMLANNAAGDVAAGKDGLTLIHRVRTVLFVPVATQTFARICKYIPKDSDTQT